MTRLIFSALAILFSGNLLAADPAPSDQEAMAQTQAFLRDKTKRDEFMASNPQAQAVQQMLNNLTLDPSLQQQIFDMAADMMPQVAAAGSNDPQVMLQMMENAKKNPEAFFKSMPPDVKRKLENTAKEIGSPRVPASK